jgi:hypothetical protein
VRAAARDSLRFGPEQTTPASDARLADVNSDGAFDLVASFRTGEADIALGDTAVCLTARIQGGPPLQGCDAIATLSATACGFGCELALALPPIAWLRARRRPAAPH